MKMARMFVLQMTSQLDLDRRVPRDGRRRANRDEMKAVKAYFGLLKNVEPALLACKAVPRGTMVPLYVRAKVPAKKIGEAVMLVEDTSGGDKKPDPGLFFGPKVTGSSVPVARPTPLKNVGPPAPVIPVGAVTNAPPLNPPMEFGPPPDAPAYSKPMAYPADNKTKSTGLPGSTLLPAAGATPGPAPLPPPALPPLATPPKRLGTLTVANVHREDVMIFVIEAEGLRFVQRLPAGEAAAVRWCPASDWRVRSAAPALRQLHRQRPGGGLAAAPSAGSGPPTPGAVRTTY